MTDEGTDVALRCLLQRSHDQDQTPPLTRIETFIMLKNTTSLRRSAARLGLGATAAVVLATALPGVAQAHVTVQGEAEGGGFSVVAFRVPNERDDASTTRLRVILPQDQPIGSVQTTAVPGWK